MRTVQRSFFFFATQKSHNDTREPTAQVAVNLRIYITQEA